MMWSTTAYIVEFHNIHCTLSVFNTRPLGTQTRSTVIKDLNPVLPHEVRRPISMRATVIRITSTITGVIKGYSNKSILILTIFTTQTMARIKKTSAFSVLRFIVFVSFLNAQAYGCSDDDSCSFPRHCCKTTNEGNFCRSKCEGLSCADDEDCAPSESCCEGKCKGRDCIERLAGWLIAVVVILVLSFLFSVGGCVYRRVYKPWKQRTLGGVIVVHPSNTGAAVLATQQQQYITQQGQQVYFSNNQAYPVQPLPYQPTHPAPTDGPKKITPVY